MAFFQSQCVFPVLFPAPCPGVLLPTGTGGTPAPGERGRSEARPVQSDLQANICRALSTDKSPNRSGADM